MSSESAYRKSKLSDVLIINNDFIVPCWILLVINIVLSVWWMILHLFTHPDKKTIQNQRRLKLFTFIFIGLMLIMFVRAVIRMITAKADRPDYSLGAGEMFWYSIFLLMAFILASNWWQGVMVNISPGEYTQFQIERNMNLMNIVFAFGVAIFFLFAETEGSTFRERFMEVAERFEDLPGYARQRVIDPLVLGAARRQGLIEPRPEGYLERAKRKMGIGGVRPAYRARAPIPPPPPPEDAGYFARFKKAVGLGKETERERRLREWREAEERQQARADLAAAQRQQVRKAPQKRLGVGQQGGPAQQPGLFGQARAGLGRIRKGFGGILGGGKDVGVGVVKGAAKGGYQAARQIPGVQAAERGVQRAGAMRRAAMKAYREPIAQAPPQQQVAAAPKHFIEEEDSADWF